jgi:N6-adenosine-specific RNA methylase IME4
MSDIKRSAVANYATMRISDIQGLPVKDICHPDGAVLCLWVPGSLLPSGLETMKAWGFEHKQTYVWVKTKKEPLKDVKRSIFKSMTGAAKLVTDLSKKDTKQFFKSFALTLANKADSIDLSNLLSFGMGRLFRQTHEICLIGTSNNGIYQ